MGFHEGLCALSVRFGESSRIFSIQVMRIEPDDSTKNWRRHIAAQRPAEHISASSMVDQLGETSRLHSWPTASDLADRENPRVSRRTSSAPDISGSASAGPTRSWDRNLGDRLECPTGANGIKPPAPLLGFPKALFLGTTLPTRRICAASRPS